MFCLRVVYASSSASSLGTLSAVVYVIKHSKRGDTLLLPNSWKDSHVEWHTAYYYVLCSVVSVLTLKFELYLLLFSIFRRN